MLHEVSPDSGCPRARDAGLVWSSGAAGGSGGPSSSSSSRTQVKLRLVPPSYRQQPVHQLPVYTQHQGETQVTLLEEVM